MARNVRIGRLIHEWSQEDLASTMCGRGHAWRQVTVSEVEKLKRHVNADELHDLAAVFEVAISKLYEEWRF